MHRKLSTGVYNFGEKYEKINGFSMFPNICFVYNLHEGEKGLVFVKWTETTFW